VSDLEPSQGFVTIEEEFEKRTEKAFKLGGEFLCIYSRRQRFQIEAAEYCREHGWVTDGELVELDSQSSEVRYWLTDAGRAHWKI
jgi:hypothetical protein